MAKKQGGGGRAKFGRGHRSPSSKVYHTLHRWETNKAKRIKRHLRKAAKHAIKLLMRSPEVSRNYEKIKELRQVVSQNHMG